MSLKKSYRTTVSLESLVSNFQLLFLLSFQQNYMAYIRRKFVRSCIFKVSLGKRKFGENTAKLRF